MTPSYLCIDYYLPLVTSYLLVPNTILDTSYLDLYSTLVTIVLEPVPIIS